MASMTATTPMKADVARRMRATAGKLDETHPEMVASKHLRSAATMLQSGMPDASKRHLDAAMELLTPRNLIRHGITDDEGHATAKAAMHQINHHRLQVMDIQDHQQRNDQQAQAAKDKAAVIQAQVQQRVAARQQAAAAKQAAIEGKTAAKPTGTGPGSQQQSGPPPDPILATSVPLAGGIMLSAQTARLARTPHPNGRPGGPGLYGKAGNKHSDYFEQIVHALMTKRGMSQADASRIAWGALRKWQHGGGKVHPEVRAAASGALAQEQAAKLSGDSLAIQLAFNPAELRGPDGQWTSLPGGRKPRYTKLKYAGGAGGFGHLRAIDAIGDKYQPQGDLKTVGMGPAADVYRTSMRAAARFTAARQMEHAYRALDTADWAARHISPDAQIDARRVRQSLAAVPGYVSNRQNPRPRPSTRPGWEQGLHPGVYRDPMNVSNDQPGIELASRLIELACPIDLAGTAWMTQPRVPAGSAGGGQFGSASQGGKQPPGGKGTRAQRRARLVKQAVTLRGEIAQLLAQIHSATHHGHSKSSTPRKKGAAATSAKQAAASKAAAKASSTKASAAKASKTMTLAQMKTRLAALRAELKTVTGEIHQLANEERAAIELSAKTAYLHEPRGRGGQWVSAGGEMGAGARRAAARRRIGSAAGYVPDRSMGVTGRSARQKLAAGHVDPSSLVVSQSDGSIKLHPAIEARVQHIAGKLDTSVEQKVSADAAAKAKAAADEARQHLQEYADAEAKDEAHKARLKFAVEAGVGLANAALAYAAARFGAPDLVAVFAGLGPLFVQLLAEWRKQL